jgi:hypothetical protein
MFSSMFISSSTSWFNFLSSSLFSSICFYPSSINCSLCSQINCISDFTWFTLTSTLLTHEFHLSSLSDSLNTGMLETKELKSILNWGLILIPLGTAYLLSQIDQNHWIVDIFLWICFPEWRST